jgi:hypothetical protein
MRHLNANRFRDFQRQRVLQLAGWMLILALAISGVCIELSLTRNGSGVSGDSVHYMEGVRNLLAGNGYSRLKADGTVFPITTFPPLYPMALAGLGLTGIQIMDAGRYLNTFLFGVNIFLAGLTTFRVSRSLWVSISASLLILTSFNLVRIHSWVMSEPLFLCLTLSALLTFSVYWEKDNRFALIATGFLTSMSILTRYIGFILPVAMCVLILFASRKPWKRRWIDTLWVVGIILLPLSLWLFRNFLEANSLANKVLVYHPFSYDLVIALLNETSSWLFPNELHLSWRLRVILYGLFVTITIGLFVFGIFKGRFLKKSEIINDGDAITGLITLFIPLYVVFLYVNALIIDATNDQANIIRYLIPVFVLGIIWVPAIYLHLGRSSKSRLVVKIAMVVLLVSLSGLYAMRTLPFIYKPGFAFGYTDTKNRNDEMVQTLMGIDPGRPILTDDYEFVYFITGRPPFSLPVMYDKASLKANLTFDQDLQANRKLLQEGTILVAFKKQDRFSPAAELLIPDLNLWRSFRDANIYIIRGNQ